MKKSVIENMLCQQFGFDHRDLDIVLVATVGAEHEFEVMHWAAKNTKKFKVKVSVEEMPYETK